MYSTDLFTYFCFSIRGNSGNWKSVHVFCTSQHIHTSLDNKTSKLVDLFYTINFERITPELMSCSFRVLSDLYKDIRLLLWLFCKDEIWVIIVKGMSCISCSLKYRLYGLVYGLIRFYFDFKKFVSCRHIYCWSMYCFNGVRCGLQAL